MTDKSIFVIILFGMLCAVSAMTVWPHKEQPMEQEQLYTQRQLLDAIRYVETGGESGPSAAVGAAGELGPYQISEAYWADAEMGHLSWREGAPIKSQSEIAIRRYMRRYCARFGAYLPSDDIVHLSLADCEDISRTHNGGPDGRNKKSTLPYWAKVEAALEAE